MALSITEAKAVNTLLGWIDPRHRHGAALDSAELRAAALILATGAQKALMAGVSPRDVPTDFGQPGPFRHERRILSEARLSVLAVTAIWRGPVYADDVLDLIHTIRTLRKEASA